MHAAISADLLANNVAADKPGRRAHRLLFLIETSHHSAFLRGLLLWLGSGSVVPTAARTDDVAARAVRNFLRRMSKSWLGLI
jgi:hypothetical protein